MKQKKIQIMVMLFLLLAVWGIPLAGWATPPVTIHSFTGTGTDGSSPYASLISANAGNKLYGMTTTGGASHAGVLFSIDLVNSNQYTALHSFTGTGTDGKYPYDNVTHSFNGTKLYGMTTYGGASNKGVIFSIDLNNNNQYTALHSFTGASNDGSYPNGSLVLSLDSTKLYGMTTYGGASNKGVVFSIDLSNSNQYAALYSFTGVDGAYPFGSPILSLDGTTLFGMTTYGGTGNKGAIFSIDLNNSNQFANLHSFAATSSEGANPYGSPIFSVDGAKIYGMTTYGGASNKGVVFSIFRNGNQYSVLHSFTGTGTDGATPEDSLTLSLDGSTLYGMTVKGGSSNYGTLFSIDLVNSNQYTTEYSFTKTGTDGAYPYGSLVLSGNLTTFYGTTSAGGGASNLGEVFSFPVPATIPLPTPTPSTACTATLAYNLALHVPYITYQTLALSADFSYEFKPGEVAFKYVDSNVLSHPSFSCAPSTLSSSLLLQIPDVLLPGGVTHVWADLAYNTAYSTGGNIVFVLTDYGTK